MDFPVPSFANLAAPPEEVGAPKSWLLYGGTGTQKTFTLRRLFLAGYFKKILFLNLDGGESVLYSDPEVKRAIKDGRITKIDLNPFEPAETKQRVEDIVFEVAGMWRAPDGSIRPNPNIPDFGYDLVFVDTVNLLHDLALKHLKATTYNDKGTHLDGRAAYGKVAEWDEEIVRLIHNSPRFTGGFVMHEKTDDGEKGDGKIKPKLSGSFKDTIATIPDLVFYLNHEAEPESGEVMLTATTGASAEVVAKNRYNFPQKLHGFDMSEVYGEIYDKIGEPRPEPIAAPVAPVQPIPTATNTEAAATAAAA